MCLKIWTQAGKLSNGAKFIVMKTLTFYWLRKVCVTLIKPMVSLIFWRKSDIWVIKVSTCARCMMAIATAGFKRISENTNSNNLRFAKSIPKEKVEWWPDCKMSIHFLKKFKFLKIYLLFAMRFISPVSFICFLWWQKEPIAQGGTLHYRMAIRLLLC